MFVASLRLVYQIQLSLSLSYSDTDTVIDRSLLLLTKVKSLQYSIGYDLPLLRLFINSLNAYLEHKSSSESFLKMLNGLERYFDLPDVKRIDSHSLNKCLAELTEGSV